MHPSDDDMKRARQRAEEMEIGLELTQQDERDTVNLLEKLDKLATSLREHAQDWDPVNPQMATRVRQQEQQLHALRAKVERLAEMETDEATAIMADIKKTLRQARGEE